MRRVFFVSCVLVALTALIAWLAPKLFAPPEQPQPEADAAVKRTYNDYAPIERLISILS